MDKDEERKILEFVLNFPVERLRDLRIKEGLQLIVDEYRRQNGG